MPRTASTTRRRRSGSGPSQPSSDTVRVPAVTATTSGRGTSIRSGGRVDTARPSTVTAVGSDSTTWDCDRSTEGTRAGALRDRCATVQVPAGTVTVVVGAPTAHRRDRPLHHVVADRRGVVDGPRARHRLRRRGAPGSPGRWAWSRWHPPPPPDGPVPGAAGRRCGRWGSTRHRRTRGPASPRSPVVSPGTCSSAAPSTRSSANVRPGSPRTRSWRRMIREICIESSSRCTGARSPDTSAVSMRPDVGVEPGHVAEVAVGLGRDDGVLQSRFAMLSTPKNPQVVGIW